MRRTRLLLLAPTAVIGLAASASAAGATTLCVGTMPAGTVCSTAFPFSNAGLANAIAAANSDSAATDVRVGPGTLTGVPAATLSGNGDRLIGAGQALTTLKFTGTSGTLLAIGAGNPTTVSDLTVEGSGFTSNGVVLRLNTGALGERVTVRERTPANASAVDVVTITTSATLRNAQLEADSDQDIGAVITNGAATLADTTISGNGGYGVQVSSNAAQQFRGLTIAGQAVGLTTDVGSTTLDDSVIDLGARANAIGVSARNFNNSSSTISMQLRRVTIVGSGTSQVGVWANADNAGETVNTNIRDSLLQATGSGAKDIRCGAAGVAGNSSLVTLNTGTRSTDVYAQTCTRSSTQDLDLSVKPATFVNAAARDFRPVWGSPVIDRGTNSATGALTDQAGATRLVDGDGNGTALVDLGAREYQHQVPTGLTAVSIPLTGTIGTPVAFTATGATDPDGDAIDYAWDFGDGSTATGASASHAYAGGGIYTVTVRAIDPSGLKGSIASGSVAVPRPAGGQDGAATPTPTPSPAAKPTPTVNLLSAPKGSTKRSKAGFSVSTKPSAAQFKLADAASLRFTAARVTSGRVSGKACKRTATKGKRCTIRTAVKGTVAVAATGTVRIAFGGTFAGKRLAAGSYELTATPFAADGVTAGKAVTYKVALR